MTSDAWRGGAQYVLTFSVETDDLVRHGGLLDFQRGGPERAAVSPSKNSIFDVGDERRSRDRLYRQALNVVNFSATALYLLFPENVSR